MVAKSLRKFTEEPCTNNSNNIFWFQLCCGKTCPHRQTKVKATFFPLQTGRSQRLPIEMQDNNLAPKHVMASKRRPEGWRLLGLVLSCSFCLVCTDVSSCWGKSAPTGIAAIGFRNAFSIVSPDVGWLPSDGFWALFCFLKHASKGCNEAGDS